MIGLTGAHRVGKSTLARAYSEKHGGAYVAPPVSAIFRELGYDPAITYDFSTRLTIQEEILRRLDLIYAQHPAENAIADRTPLDLLGYTMAEAVGHAVCEEDQARFKKYVQDCFDVTNRRFSMVVLVQPGIPLKDEPGKAALNEAYIEHFNSLVLGLTVDERLKAMHFYLPRPMTDLDERVAALEYALGRTRQRASQELVASGCFVH